MKFERKMENGIAILCFLIFVMLDVHSFYFETTLVVFVKRKCEQKGPKKVSTFSTRFHVVSNAFPKYQMLTF